MEHVVTLNGQRCLGVTGGDIPPVDAIPVAVEPVDPIVVAVEPVDPVDPVDPIGHDSPIPKEKRGVSSVEQSVSKSVPPAPQPRRASLDTQQSQHNLFLHNMGFPHDHSTTCAQYGPIRNICCVD